MPTGGADGETVYHVTQCPLKEVPAGTWDVIELARLYKEGLPPAAGGALDQAKVFLDACRVIWAEEARWREKLEKK